MSAGGYVQAGLTAYELISGAQQAEMVRDQAALQNKINNMNADYIELDAFKAEQQGLTEEARYQSTIDKTIGAEKVANAVNNVDSNFGTAKALMEESKLTGFLNKLDIRNHAHDVALGYHNQAANLRLQGVFNNVESNTRASAIQNASYINAGRSVAGYYSGKGG